MISEPALRIYCTNDLGYRGSGPMMILSIPSLNNVQGLAVQSLGILVFAPLLLNRSKIG